MRPEDRMSRINEDYKKYRSEQEQIQEMEREKIIQQQRDERIRQEHTNQKKN